MNKELKHIKENDFKVGGKVNWEFMSGREFTIIEINEYTNTYGNVFYNIRLAYGEKSFEVSPFEITYTKDYIREEKINSLLHGNRQKNS